MRNDFTQRGPDGVWRQGGGKSDRDGLDMAEAARSKREHFAELKRMERLRVDLVTDANRQPKPDAIRLSRQVVDGGARHLDAETFRCFAWSCFPENGQARRRVLRTGRIILVSGDAVILAEAKSEAA